MFERFGRVTRVFLARDRETQRAKGFAFISYADRSDAARACEKIDGCEYSGRPHHSTSFPIITSKAEHPADIVLFQSVIVTLSCASSLRRGRLDLLLCPCHETFWMVLRADAVAKTFTYCMVQLMMMVRYPASHLLHSTTKEVDRVYSSSFTLLVIFPTVITECYLGRM